VADAADGEQALERLIADADAVALVVLDLKLPGAISGKDFRQCQLADARLSAIPTVVITACELGPEDREPLRPDAWLEKPFRFDALLEVVERYVTTGVPPS
jgi:CheY-like chemotaxis protein